MTMRASPATLLTIVALALPGACAPRPAAETPAAPTPHSAAGPDHVGYRAGGNEPFWSLTFGEGTMEFFDLGDGDTIRAARPRPERVADGWSFAADADDRPFIVRIQELRCTDSMSGQAFPHTVRIDVGGRTYSGCGGDTASLLVGDEWVVVSLEDEGIGGDARPSLEFASDGALTGTGGCNRFRADYRITGEGIRIGPVLATRMACADPEASSRETRFFALLEQVARFAIADDGGLELLAADRPVIVARR